MTITLMTLAYVIASIVHNLIDVPQLSDAANAALKLPFIEINVKNF